jgi:hypothetical protein
MAEEMANAIATKESKRTGRSITKNNKTARLTKSEKSSVAVGVAPETTENPQQEAAPDSGDSESQTAQSGFDFRESFHAALANNFSKIIEGLMKGNDKVNPAGSRMLFDALAKLAANPGKVEHQTEAGIILSDLLGPGFDWNSVQHEDRNMATESDQAGVDADIGGRESE